MAAAALVSVVALPVGAASAHPPPGTGITTCTGWTGNLHFIPPLKNGGISNSETIRITATVASCTGGAPTPASGTILGHETIHIAGANNCLTIFPSAPPGGTFNVPPNDAQFTEVIKWAPAHTIFATKIKFPPPGPMDGLPIATGPAAADPITFAAFGPTVPGASYPDTTASQALSTVETYATITGGGPDTCGTQVTNLAINAASGGMY